MPTRHAGRLAKNEATWLRLSCFFNTAFPRSSTPCTWMMFFAKSIPIVVIFFMVASPVFVEQRNFHFGTQMPL